MTCALESSLLLLCIKCGMYSMTVVVSEVNVFPRYFAWICQLSGCGLEHETSARRRTRAASGVRGSAYAPIHACNARFRSSTFSTACMYLRLRLYLYCMPAHGCSIARPTALSIGHFPPSLTPHGGDEPVATAVSVACAQRSGAIASPFFPWKAFEHSYPIQNLTPPLAFFCIWGMYYWGRYLGRYGVLQWK